MFPKEILGQRMDRAKNALKEFDVELWVSVGRETHYTVEPALLYLMPMPGLSLTALIVGSDGKSTCIVGKLDAEEIESYGAIDRLLVYGSVDEFDKMLEMVIKEYSPQRTIALNMSKGDPSADGLSMTQYNRIKGILDEIGFEGDIISSHRIMKRMRAQKSEEEIKKIETTVLTAMKFYDEAKSYIKKGMSGRDIQKFFQQKVNEIDADFSWPKLGNPFVSVGTKSSYLCKRPPEDIFVEPGDLINVDFGLRIDGFASDNQRSFYALKDMEEDVPEEIQRAFEAVQEAIRAAVSKMRPGVYTTELRDAANEVFRAKGYPEVGGLGHEVGTFAHEGGISCGSDAGRLDLDGTLEVGMVFTMEPAIITSYGRLCQEEVVVVTQEGGKYLSIPQDKVWLIR